MILTEFLEMCFLHLSKIHHPLWLLQKEEREKKKQTGNSLLSFEFDIQNNKYIQTIFALLLVICTNPQLKGLAFVLNSFWNYFFHFLGPGLRQWILKQSW